MYKSVESWTRVQRQIAAYVMRLAFLARRNPIARREASG